MFGVPLRISEEISKQYAEIPYQKHPSTTLRAALSLDFS